MVSLCRTAHSDGAVIGTQGFYVDVTPSDESCGEEGSAVVAQIAEHRAAIEQTKVMLMLIYRIPADAAVELLKWRSQATKVKLRALAQQLSADFQTLPYRETLPSRTTYGRLLLTAPQDCPRHGSGASSRPRRTIRIADEEP